MKFPHLNLWYYNRKMRSDAYAFYRQFLCRAFVKEEELGTRRCIKAAMNWLAVAQDATGGGGVSKAYSLITGWLPPYPEATGYIIPTFFNYYHLSKEEEYKTRAIRMADWELTLQYDDGSFEGGPVHSGMGPMVFDTGQIIFGLVRAYEETGFEKYMIAAVKAGNWLADIQSINGSWEIYDLNGIVHSYSSRVAWALLELFRVTQRERFLLAAQRNADWVLKQQDDNGWFKNSGFELGNSASTHSIAYTIEGVLECGVRLKEKGYIDAARRCADALLGLQRVDGSFSGEYDHNWQCKARYSCLVGDSQIAVVFARLFEILNESSYIKSFRQCVNHLKIRQDRRTSNENVRGAIPGSWPIYGKYFQDAFPVWAAKFFVDALLLGERLVLPT